MRLKDYFQECLWEGLTPVLPLYPFPIHDVEAGFLHLVDLARHLELGALGISHPGNSCVDFDDWDLFHFLYALKYQTGLPLVLAARHRDVSSFGPIPYAQEGNRVGLDALLLREPCARDLEVLAAELTGNGIGLALESPGRGADGEGFGLWRHATAFWVGADRPVSLPAVLPCLAPADGAPASPPEGVAGWILSRSLPDGGGDSLPPGEEVEVLRAWMRGGLLSS